MLKEKKKLVNWNNVLYVVAIGLFGVVLGSIATCVFVLKNLNIPLW